MARRCWAIGVEWGGTPITSSGPCLNSNKTSNSSSMGLRAPLKTGLHPGGSRRRGYEGWNPDDFWLDSREGRTGLISITGQISRCEPPDGAAVSSRSKISGWIATLSIRKNSLGNGLRSNGLDVRPGARKVITVSDHSARDIVSLYGLPYERIAVIPNGVSEDFRPMADPADFVELQNRLAIPIGQFILFVGGADPRKNHRTLLKACAAHKQLLKDYYLVLVGDRTYRHDDMHATARSLGIE